MKVQDLFDRVQGNSFELINMEVDGNSNVNFVARTAENNGVTARVRQIDNAKPFLAGSITVALSGSVLSSFVQDKPFYTGFHVMVLHPKKEMRLEEKLFYCHCLKMNAYRYGYGRQANKTLKDIDLPPLPNWLKKYTIDFSPIATQIQRRDLPIDTKQWQQFKVGELFYCSTTKTFSHDKSGDIPYITRSSVNNGFSGFVAADKPNPANCITIGAEGIVAFYQNKDFASGIKIYTLRHASLNRYNALFICTVLNCYQYKYSYGRARILDKIKEEIIKLPVDASGKPDWQFMESYIRSLPYSDLI